jgi:hypothetical protein
MHTFIFLVLMTPVVAAESGTLPHAQYGCLPQNAAGSRSAWRQGYGSNTGSALRLKRATLNSTMETLNGGSQ